MQRLSAVVTTTYANSTGIEQSSQVVGMQTINDERGQGAAVGLLLGAWPQQMYPIDSA